MNLASGTTLPTMDPTILNPAMRFARPDTRHTRSPSHSPTRRHPLIEHALDPLLADLSPTSTLEALQSTGAVSAEAGTHKRALLDSAAVVSTLERALGIKAALAGKKVREWYRELSAWPWPTPSDDARNGFEPPPISSEDGSEGAIAKPTRSEDKGRTESGYWGSLPAQWVQKYEERIETIRDDLEALDLEELKGHVRATRQRKQSGQAQLAGGDSTTLAHMDDFTALITATIMQALPQISRLHTLLGIWSTRLMVLRQVPGYLECVEKAQAAMNSAWNVAKSSSSQQESKDRIGMDRQTFSTIRGILERRVLEMGQRLDSMLDALEGRADTLPDLWIDCMDELEADFGAWVVNSERLVLENELSAGTGRHKNRTTSVQEGPQCQTCPPLVSEPEAPGGSAYLQSDGASELSVRLQRLLSSRSASPPHRDSSSRSVSPKVEKEEVQLRTPDSASSEPSLPRYNPVFPHVDAGIVARGRKTLKPVPLILKKPRDPEASNAASELSSDISFPGSSTSDYFTDMSSPEIKHASRAEYFGAPIEVTTPNFTQRDSMSPTDTVWRQSSQRTERGQRTMSLDLSRGIPSPNSQRSRASSFIPEMTIPENRGLAGPWPVDQSGGISNLRTRRASMQSFEIVPRHEVNLQPDYAEHSMLIERQVRNITISRSASYSAAPPTQSHDEGATAGNGTLDLKAPSQTCTHDIVADDGALLNRNEGRDTGYHSLGGYEGDSNYFQPSMHQPGPPRPSTPLVHPPRSSTAPKNRFEEVTDLPPGSTPAKIRRRRKSDTSPRKPDSRVLSPIKNGAEQLEARINSILTEIPGHIRLISGPELDAPEVKPAPPDPKTPLPRSKTTPRISRAQTSTPLPSMTLAPAQHQSVRSRPNGGDPEIKLYHLHQSGKDAPIKLFVRLVGDAGERVMVRIGGGWADLGEYLKEYASHHGKRSVSDTRFAIQELPTTPITSSPALVGNGSAPTSRPGSSYGPGPTMPASSEVPTAFKPFEATPGSVDSLRPGSAHSWKDEESPLGGAGPKSKKVDMSPTKQAWVDGMLEQARHAAMAEKGRDFGDLGKVGGTKRVFLRSKTTQ